MSFGGDVLAWEILEHYLIRSTIFRLEAHPPHYITDVERLKHCMIIIILTG